MKLTKIQRKKYRVRNKIKKVSSNNRFRLSVSRSLKNISAQIIDDINNKTLVSASSDNKDLKNSKKRRKMEGEELTAYHKKRNSEKTDFIPTLVV